MARTTTKKSDEIIDDGSLQDELETQKAQAELLGVEVTEEDTAESIAEKIVKAVNSDKSHNVVEEKVSLTTKMTETAKAHALVRCRITCLNPTKSAFEGEIFTVGNDFIPPIRRYVPFNKVWHVEAFLLEVIKGRTFLYMPQKPATSGSQGFGSDFQQRELRPEFSVEILPQLTEEELEQMRIEQSNRTN